MTTKRSPHVNVGSYLDTCRWTAPYFLFGFLIRILGVMFELVVTHYRSQGNIEKTFEGFLKNKIYWYAVHLKLNNIDFLYEKTLVIRFVQLFNEVTHS